MTLVTSELHRARGRRHPAGPRAAAKAKGFFFQIIIFLLSKAVCVRLSGVYIPYSLILCLCVMIFFYVSLSHILYYTYIAGWAFAAASGSRCEPATRRPPVARTRTALHTHRTHALAVLPGGEKKRKKAKAKPQNACSTKDHRQPPATCPSQENSHWTRAVRAMTGCPRRTYPRYNSHRLQNAEDSTRVALQGQLFILHREKPKALLADEAVL